MSKTITQYIMEIKKEINHIQHCFNIQSSYKCISCPRLLILDLTQLHNIAMVFFSVTDWKEDKKRSSITTKIPEVIWIFETRKTGRIQRVGYFFIINNSSRTITFSFFTLKALYETTTCKRLYWNLNWEDSPFTYFLTIIIWSCDEHMD